MSRWVDVVVAADASAAALQAVTTALGPVNVQLDTRPRPAAGCVGREHELCVEGHPLTRVLKVLRDADIAVVSARCRIGETLVIDP